MKVKVVKDTTLTVTKGQEIDIVEHEVDLLLRMGYVELVEKAKATKPTAKPRKKKAE